MDDHDAVLQANAAFYHAFESLELKRMEDVWLRAPHIKCVHPGWGLLVGWGPVMESWQRIFANTVMMRFTLAHQYAEVVGDFAWVTLTERIESQSPDGTVTAQVQATNLFQRDAGRWFLVHHHGSQVFPPLAEVAPERMH